MNNDEDIIDEALEPSHEEEEEIEGCGQPLDPKSMYIKEHDYIISRTTGMKMEVSFGPLSSGLVPKNPFVSKAQQGYLHSHPEILGKKKLAEFDRASKGLKLPKRVKK